MLLLWARRFSSAPFQQGFLFIGDPAPDHGLHHPVQRRADLGSPQAQRRQIAASDGQPRAVEAGCAGDQRVQRAFGGLYGLHPAVMGTLSQIVGHFDFEQQTEIGFSDLAEPAKQALFRIEHVAVVQRHQPGDAKNRFVVEAQALQRLSGQARA